MSGGSLPRTGVKAAVTIGGVAGVGSFTVPMPVVLALVAVATVIAGAILVRLSFRAGRPASRR